jgi:HEAT repeat-containing protein 6
MLGATRDDSPVVRSQACRTLGVYILNSSLNIDPIFVTDVAQNLVEAMKDPNLNVRIRACWSVANLCDALVALRDVQNDEESTLTEGAPLSCISWC